MTGFKESGKKLFLTLKLHIKIFFKNQVLALLYFYGALTLCKNPEKSVVSRIFKDAQTSEFTKDPPPRLLNLGSNLKI